MRREKLVLVMTDCQLNRRHKLTASRADSTDTCTVPSTKNGTLGAHIRAHGVAHSLSEDVKPLFRRGFNSLRQSPEDALVAHLGVGSRVGSDADVGQPRQIVPKRETKGSLGVDVGRRPADLDFLAERRESVRPVNDKNGWWERMERSKTKKNGVSNRQMTKTKSLRDDNTKVKTHESRTRLLQWRNQEPSSARPTFRPW